MEAGDGSFLLIHKPLHWTSFDVVNNSKDQCEQTVTAQRFKVGFKAPKDIKIDATFKGNPIELNLIPAQQGENPADFELFIKG